MDRRDVPIRWMFALTLLCLPACTSAPSDLREWRASDHDQPDEQAAAQVPAGADSGGMSGAAKMLGVDQVVLVTWRQNCTRCHGTLGRGDGPEGPMYGARDLSDPAFQSATSDEQMAASIGGGKGRMPKFALPASTISGLVHLVRMMNRDRPPPMAGGARPEAPASAPPAHSAAAHRGAPKR